MDGSNISPDQPTKQSHRPIHYTREFGRILVQRPLSECVVAKELPFVFEVYYQFFARATVITRCVKPSILKVVSKGRSLEVEDRIFVDFSESEVEDVLAVIRRGLA